MLRPGAERKRQLFGARSASIIGAALTLAVGACGDGGSAAKDAAGTAGRDGATADAGDAKAGSGGGGATGAAGSTGVAGQDGGTDAAAGADGGGTDGAAGTSGGRRLLTGTVALVGSGDDTCTNQPGATSDRWCAFLRLSAVSNAIELWVIDVTALVAGQQLVCDGTAPGCLRLSRTAFVDPSSGPGIHRFDGDTLIYYADAGANAAQSFVGTVWAWRPGWPAGRRLTATTGTDCIGSPKSDAIGCLQNVGPVVAGELSADMLAGRAPATDNAPLPMLERTVIAVNTEALGVQKFQLAFSDDGAWVGWSGRTAGAAPETLKVQKIDDAASRQTVASDVTRWEITPDGASWLWLRGYNHNPAAPMGTLERAPFPAGTTPVTLATGVATYHGFPGGSILYQTTVGAELRRMPDRAAPATTQLLDQGIAGVFDFSEDGSTVVYSKTFDQDGLVDMFVRNASAAAPCSITNPSTAVATATLFSKAGLVLWARLDPLSGDLVGSSTSVASCKTTTFANNVLRWLPAGDDALTILDETALTADDSTLRFSQLTNGVLPTQGAQLQTHVTSIYAPVPTLPAILYTGATMATAGLYVYLGPPLSSSTKPAGDAGVTEGGATEGGADAGGGDAGGGTDDAADSGDAGDGSADDGG